MVFETIAAGIVALASWIASALASLGSAVVAGATAVGSSLAAAVSYIATYGGAILSGVGEFLVQGAMTGITWLAEAAYSVGLFVWEGLSMLGSGLANMGQAVVSFLTNCYNTLAGGYSSVMSTMSSWYSSLGTAGKALIKPFVSMAKHPFLTFGVYKITDLDELLYEHVPALAGIIEALSIVMAFAGGAWGAVKYGMVIGGDIGKGAIL